MLAAGDAAYHCGAGPAHSFNCSYRIEVDHNRFYFPTASSQPGWDSVCGCWPDTRVAGPCPYTTFASWQADNHDRESIVSLTLSDAELLARARSL